MLDFQLFILAIIPILLFIALGIFLKYIHFLPDTGWYAVEKIIYYILFPALLIHSIANIDYNFEDFMPMAAALNIATLAMFILSFFAWSNKTLCGARFSSILQNNIRFNSFVALTIASQYNAGQFLPLVAIGVGMLIPTVNILSVWSLVIWGKSTHKESPFSSLFKNPLLIACAIGFAIQYFDIPLRTEYHLGLDFGKHILEPLAILGKATIPLALIAVGTGINFELMKTSASSRIFWALFRNLAFPIIALLSCYIFGIQDLNMILATVIITASPTATNSYILSRQMGGDAPFMASLIGTSTLISAITLPLIIFIILNSGILDVAY
ncbi:MAG: putative permease [Alphaproteobacteria bacterium]|jgi:predicted permease